MSRTTVALTLALGIGLATAVFTVAHTMLVQRLPVRDQDRVVAMWGASADGSFANFPLTVDEFREFARGVNTLESVAFQGYEGSAASTFRDNGQAYRISRALVSGNFFDVLGAQPVLGRLLRPEDDVSGATPVGVISHRLWQQRFGGDTGVLNIAVTMHETGRSISVVGVMPKGLDYPRGTDLWVPFVATAADNGEGVRLTSGSVTMVGRLRDGANAKDAAAELTRFYNRPGGNAFGGNVSAVVTPLPAVLLGDTRLALMVVAAAAGLLLLVTCINVANLMLVHGLSRVRDAAVRMALGASRTRVMAQILRESLVIAVAGAVLGTAIAVGAIRAFVALAPPGFPRLEEIALNTSLLIIAIAVTGVATILFSIAPAVMSSRFDLARALRAGSRDGGRGRQHAVATEMLVGGQIALAVLMLSFAGLVGRSFVEMRQVDLAYAPERMLVVELSSSGREDQRDARMATLERILERVAAIQEVDAVTPTMGVPLSPESGVLARLARPGQTPDDAAGNPVMNLEVVTPNYFASLGIQVVRGRVISDEDRAGTAPVVVISESAAKHHWPNENPIGKTFAGRTAPFTVVGVVADTRYRNFLDTRPSVYLPLRQSPFPMLPATLLIRTNAPAGTIAPVLRNAVAEIDNRIEVASIAPLTDLLSVPLAQPRLNAILLAAFALTAVALAAIGLFGVIARAVQQRMREFGIRMALGATSGSVTGLVLGRGMRIAILGAGVGLAVAFMATRLVSSMLFGVTPSDPATLLAVVAGVLLTAALASVLPARKGAAADPAALLRGDE